MTAGEKTRRELRAEYKTAGTTAGVFQVRNLVDGRVLVASGLDVQGIINSHRFQLGCGGHRNRALQASWRELGAASFAFEVLDTLAPDADDPAGLRAELTELEKLWLEKLQPYGERGYNERPAAEGREHSR